MVKGEKGRQAETLARRARVGSFCARRSNDPLAERETRSRARGRISFCIYLYKNRSTHSEEGAIVGSCRGGKIENKNERHAYTSQTYTYTYTHIYCRASCYGTNSTESSRYRFLGDGTLSRFSGDG